MSLPFDSTLCLRDSTRAVVHLSPNICSMILPECVIVIVIFQSSNLSSVLVQPCTSTLFPSVQSLEPGPTRGCKHAVEVHKFQSVGTRAMAGCLFQRLSEASLFLKNFFVFEFFCFLFSGKRKTKS